MDQAKEKATDLQKRLEKTEAEVSRHQSDLQEVVLRARSFAKIDTSNLSSPILLFDRLLGSLEEKVKTAIKDKEEELATSTKQLTSSFDVEIAKLGEQMKEKEAVSLFHEVDTFPSSWCRCIDHFLYILF